MITHLQSAQHGRLRHRQVLPRRLIPHHAGMADVGILHRLDITGAFDLDGFDIWTFWDLEADGDCLGFWYGSDDYQFDKITE